MNWRSPTPLFLAALAAGCALGGGLAGCAKYRNRTPRPPKIETIKPRVAPVVAGKKAKVYHTRHCQYAANLDSPTGYKSPDDAEAAGKLPCQFCNPRNYNYDEAEAPPERETPAPKGDKPSPPADK